MKKKPLVRAMPGELTAKVYNRIKEQIAAGLLTPGQCVPSERELEKLMKVSRVTVRRGLDKLVLEGLLRREPGRGYFLPDPSRSNGHGGNGHAVVFLHDHDEEALAAGAYHARLWAGAREEAARTGYLTMISAVRAELLTAEMAGSFASTAVGAICDHTDPEALRMLARTGLPIVQVDYYNTAPGIDVVAQDDIGGVLTAAHHLFGCGHRRIGYLDTAAMLRQQNRAANAERRTAAFLMACEQLGISARFRAEADLLRETAVEGTRALLDAGVTALIVPHGELWPSVSAVLAERAVEYPALFGVVTWGDPSVGSENGSLPFPTSVTWCKEQMGREAVRRLMLRIERPDTRPVTTIIPATLVDRQTGGRRK